MKGRDMKYFTDDEEEKRVRDYRKARDTYDFALEPRHVALLVVVAMIVGVLLFSVGYITGKSQADKLAKGPEGGTGLAPTPSAGGDLVSDADKPKVDFYDTLGGDEVTTEEMGSYTPPGTTGETAKPPVDTALGPKPTDTSGKLYFIMVTAIKDKKKAEDLASSLKADGFTTYTKDVGNGMYRVGIRWYKTKEEADKALLDLKSLLAKDKYRGLKLEPMISEGKE